MEHKRQLELAQVLKLSPTLLQSMGILQMTTLELADYLQDLALENPVMEETPGARETAWDAFASQVPWLAGERWPPAGRRWGTWPARPGTGVLGVFPGGAAGPEGAGPALAGGVPVPGGLAGRPRPAGSGGSGGPDPGRGAGGPAGGGVAALQSLDPAGVGAQSAGESLALQLKRRPGDHRVALAICEKGLDLLARAAGPWPWPGSWGAQAIRALDPNPVGAWAVKGGDRVPPPRCLGGGDRRDLADLCEPMGPASVPPQPGLPADGPGGPRRRGGGLPPPEDSAGPVGAAVRPPAAGDPDAVPHRLGGGPRGLFPGRTSVPGPLLGRELAETLGLHPSTVSRTLGHKALQCRQGSFPWAGSLAGRWGGALPKGVQARIAQLVAEEDARCPYSDQGLMERLQAEGIPWPGERWPSTARHWDCRRPTGGNGKNTPSARCPGFLGRGSASPGICMEFNRNERGKPGREAMEHPPARDIPNGRNRAKASDLAGIIRRPWWRTWRQPALPWALCGAGRCCPGRG